MSVRVINAISTAVFIAFSFSCAVTGATRRTPSQFDDSVLSGTPLSTVVGVEKETLSVELLDKSAIVKNWGKTMETNPFIPWEKTFSGPMYQIAVLGIRTKSAITAQIFEPEAFLADGTTIGQSYEKDGFFHFWQIRTDEGQDGWAKKSSTIERVVPNFNSETPLSSGKLYAIPIIISKDAQMPSKYKITIAINGEAHDFEIVP